MTAYGDGILAGLLRTDAAVVAEVPPAGGDSRIYTRQPADLALRLPCLVVRVVPGGRAVGPLADSSADVPFQLDAYAATARDAHVAARTAVQALTRAARLRRVTADGWLSALADVAGPADAGDVDTPSGVARSLVTGSAGVRKP